MKLGCEEHRPKSIDFPTFDVVRVPIEIEEQRNLVDLLQPCRLFKATKPRDKLFAVRGLLVNWPKSLLRPIYDASKSVREASINTAECIVAEGNDAKLLSSAGNQVPFVLTGKGSS